MKMATRAVGIALLLMAGRIVPLAAQQAATTGELAMVQQADEEADRAAVRELFARPEIQRAAKIGGVDLARAEARLGTLGGDQLHRAATQARALDSRLGGQAGAQVISLQVTTLIVILLLLIIIILVA